MNWPLIIACVLLFLGVLIVAAPSIYQALREEMAKGESPERPTIPRRRGRCDRIHLSKADQEAIARALIDPVAPNAALRRAFKRRNELLRSEKGSDTAPKSGELSKPLHPPRL